MSEIWLQPRCSNTSSLSVSVIFVAHSVLNTQHSLTGQSEKVKGARYLTQQCKQTLKMALTAHNALRDHVPFRALYTTLPVKVRYLMGKWGHYRRKVKFNLIIIIFGQVRRAGLKSPNGPYTARGPYFAHVWLCFEGVDCGVGTLVFCLSTLFTLRG